MASNEDPKKSDEDDGSADRLPDDPITRQLRDAYQSVASESLPDDLNALLERLKRGGD